MKSWVLLLLLAILGGLMGVWSGIPVGALLGALLLVALLQIYFRRLPKFSPNGKKIIQILLGGNIGLSFTSDSLNILQVIWLPALIIPIIQLAIGICVGYILMKFCKFDFATAFCSAVPAGMSEITMIAEEYHANVPLVITIHILRVFFIVFLIPFSIFLLF